MNLNNFPYTMLAIDNVLGKDNTCVTGQIKLDIIF